MDIFASDDFHFIHSRVELSLFRLLGRRSVISPDLGIGGIYFATFAMSYRLLACSGAPLIGGIVICNLESRDKVLSPIDSTRPYYSAAGSPPSTAFLFPFVLSPKKEVKNDTSPATRHLHLRPPDNLHRHNRRHRPHPSRHHSGTGLPIPPPAQTSPNESENSLLQPLRLLRRQRRPSFPAPPSDCPAVVSSKGTGAIMSTDRPVLASGNDEASRPLLDPYAVAEEESRRRRPRSRCQGVTDQTPRLRRAFVARSKATGSARRSTSSVAGSRYVCETGGRAARERHHRREHRHGRTGEPSGQPGLLGHAGAKGRPRPGPRARG